MGACSRWTRDRRNAWPWVRAVAAAGGGRRPHLRVSFTNGATKLREPGCTENTSNGLGNRQNRQRTAVRRYRTQEVAGSSPASSTPARSAARFAGHDDFKRFASIPALAADAGEAGIGGGCSDADARLPTRTFVLRSPCDRQRAVLARNRHRRRGRDATRAPTTSAHPWCASLQDLPRAARRSGGTRRPARPQAPSIGEEPELLRRVRDVCANASRRRRGRDLDAVRRRARVDDARGTDATE